jgi:hypothetical protein
VAVLTDGDLREIASRCEAATPGPWMVRQFDDDHAMGLVAVTAGNDDADETRWPHFDVESIVCMTLLQYPRMVDIKDQRWQENATFISQARTDIPMLLAEINRLREGTVEES